MEAAVDQLIALFNERFAHYEVRAIGHRMVQGGLQHMEPEQVSDQLLAALSKLVPLAPGHLPSEITAIRAFSQVFPKATQIVCFDTAFHQHMPFVARHYALPEKVLGNRACYATDSMASPASILCKRCSKQRLKRPAAGSSSPTWATAPV